MLGALLSILKDLLHFPLIVRVLWNLLLVKVILDRFLIVIFVNVCLSLCFLLLVGLMILLWVELAFFLVVLLAIRIHFVVVG